MEQILALIAQAATLLQQAHQALNHHHTTQGNPAAQAGGGFGGNVAASGFGTTGAGVGAAKQTVQGAQPNMFGAVPAQAATPSVTPDMIQQLITPLVQNEQIKSALTAQMQQMGITNLPDARPDQLPELYQRFQNVEQQAKAAGLIGGTAAQAGTPSII